LKKYGLINDEGSKDERRVQVSDLAVRILEHPDVDKREAAIREAALKPTIHREMWDLYADDLPSDSNLLWTLTRDRGFTQNGAREFLKEYRETLDFSDLALHMEAPTMAVGHEEAGNDSPLLDNAKLGLQALAERVSQYSPGDIVGTSIPATSKLQVYTVPVGVGANVVVQGEFPMSEGEWSQFLAVLTAMKPALVSAEED
jgi:hypothetical protein